MRVYARLVLCSHAGHEEVCASKVPRDARAAWRCPQGVLWRYATALNHGGSDGAMLDVIARVSARGRGPSDSKLNLAALKDASRTYITEEVVCFNLSLATSLSFARVHENLNSQPSTLKP